MTVSAVPPFNLSLGVIPLIVLMYVRAPLFVRDVESPSQLSMARW